MKNVNTNKRVDVKTVMNQIKVHGTPVDRTDFWFYVEGDIKTVFHVTEGDGTNLLPEDEEEGFNDYIYYDVFKGDVSYKMIDEYMQGEYQEDMEDLMYDGGQVLLYGYYSELTLKQICYKVLHLFGYQNPERAVVRIISGKCVDDAFYSNGTKENQDSLARQTCIAIWYKTKGNMKKAMEILRNKIPLDPGYVKAVTREEKNEVAKMGAILHVVTDEDFPKELKEQENVSLCYIEKNGYYSPFPVFCGIK